MVDREGIWLCLSELANISSYSNFGSRRSKIRPGSVAHYADEVFSVISVRRGLARQEEAMYSSQEVEHGNDNRSTLMY